MSIRVFPLIQADKDSATVKAEKAVTYYADKRKKSGKRLWVHREYEFRNWYVGFCAENAIGRILHARFGEGEEFGSDWDIFIPRIGYVQVKSTHIHRRNPFPVLEPRNAPNPEHQVWLTYFRETDIQKVRELTWGEVLECPKKDDEYQVPVAKEFWANVAE